MKRTFAVTLLVLFGALLASGVESRAQEAKQEKQEKQNVAILIFDGVQIIDYTGPYEVLGGMGKRHVYTVAEKADAVTTNMGMRVVPNYTFENQPKPDIIIVPGGGVDAHLENQKVIGWIRESARDARYVMSVCNGAFFLAKAGLLDGLEATTTAGLIDKLAAMAPKTRVVRDRRFVDNGKIITTGGLSAGIDGALHLIEKLDGTGWAQMTAYGIEYDWRPESGYARGSHADQKLPAGIYDVIWPAFEPLSFVGGADSWEEKWGVPSNMSAAELVARLREKWVADARWTKADVSKVNHASPLSVWKLTDDKGQAWEASASVEQTGNRLVLVLKVVRGAGGTRARLN
ncbi:MAG TPA: DJ-1/PfpI family protein [Pyrinomonadaceae bacterium]|jgi:putative intracellular protease/amidase